jgi:hypothetical protein
VYTVTGDVTITGTSTGSVRVVVVPSGENVNITLDNVNLTTIGPPYPSFDMDGATVNLTLTGYNTLQSSEYGFAGIHAPSGATLTITAASTGRLDAFGNVNGAGIGGNSGETGGTITINGGTVNSISFGITAAAGIGGGDGGDGGSITINGGTVFSNGIGYGVGGTTGTFALNGDAYVQTGFLNAPVQTITKGILFIGDGGPVSGTVYGNVTLPDHAVIPSNETLNVPSSATLTIPTGITLSNSGTINNSGTIVNNGAITNYGTIDNQGTIYDSGSFAVGIRTNNKITPVVTTWPAAASIVYGEALSASVLSGGVIAGTGTGTFVWTSGTTVPPAGTNSYEVTFTPANTTNYYTLAQNVSVTVKATPTAAELSYANPFPEATYDGSQHGVSVSAATGVTGLGIITVYYESGTVYPKSDILPTTAATYAVTVDIAAGANYAAGTLSLGNFTITRATTGFSATSPTIQILVSNTSSNSLNLDAALSPLASHVAGTISYALGAFNNQATGTNDILSINPALSGATLTYTGNGQTTGTATQVITISSSRNYADITATITFEAIDKTVTTVTATAPASITYGGTLGNPGATAAEGGTTFTYSYSGILADGGGTAYGPTPTKPTNPGEYTVTATLDSPTHMGNATSATFTISRKTLSWVAGTADEKTYDGTTNAAVDIYAQPTLSGVINSDDVTVSIGTANFANANAGMGITVTGTGYHVNGTATWKYNAPTDQPGLGTADISKATLTIDLSTAGVLPKIYDGTTTATVTGVELVGEVASENLLHPADFTWTADFDDANAGATKTVTVTVTLVSNALTDNYQLPTVTADIINQSIEPSPEQIAVAAAKLLLENATYIVAQTTANTPSTVKTWLTKQINNLLSGTGVSASDIAIANFSAAEGGTWLNWRGKNGSFSFTVTLSSGTITDTAGQSGSITARFYVIPPAQPTVPGRPIEVTATPGDGQATVKFTTVSTGGTPIQFYTVTSEPEGITATGGFSPIIVTGLTNGVEYTFTVTATNVIGTSEASAPSNAVTPSTKTGIADVETRHATSLHAVSINGGLQILGLVPGEVFSVFTLQGKLIYQGKAIAEEQFVRIPAAGVYLVLAGERRIKAIR